MKIIIFSQWVVMVDVIVNELKKCLKETSIYSVTGRDKNKYDIIQDFRSDEKNSILVASDCINYGLSIQEADVVIHMDVPFSPSKIEQREGRADRLSRKNSLLVIKLLIEDSIEERVIDLLEQKQKYFLESIEGDININLLKELFKENKIKK